MAARLAGVIDFLVAAVLAAVVMVFAIERDDESSCARAGGHIVRGGLDRLCVAASGDAVAVSYPVPIGVVMWGGWIAITLGLFVLNRRLVRARGPRA